MIKIIKIISNNKYDLPVQYGNIQLPSHPFGHNPDEELHAIPALHFPHVF